ncbi:MAG: TfoX/Sxy family protein [Mycobacteriaceae bacterium]|nr:TfoX/Sxy family protein [Mycobacteriaceae bacterium]
MAYDEELAERIRDELGERGVLANIVEKKMFGGLAFLIDGNMAVAASGKGGLLVRVDPDRTDALVDGETVTTMVMGGRETRGWLRVVADAVHTDSALAEWVGLGISYAGSLPPK